MIDHAWRKDFMRISDHLQRIGAVFLQLAFEDISNLGGDTHNDSALRGGSLSNGRPNCRIAFEVLPGPVKVGQAMEQNVLASYWQPTLRNPQHPNSAGHDSDPVEHFQVTLPKTSHHSKLRPDGAVGRDRVACVECDSYVHLPLSLAELTASEPRFNAP